MVQHLSQANDTNSGRKLRPQSLGAEKRRKKLTRESEPKFQRFSALEQLIQVIFQSCGAIDASWMITHVYIIYIYRLTVYIYIYTYPNIPGRK